MSIKLTGLSLVTAIILGGCGSNNNTNEANANLVINEFKSNVPEDEHSMQYIELRGTPNQTIKNIHIVVVDGDEDEEGVVDYAYNLDGVKVGENGLIILKNLDQYNDLVSLETTVINDEKIKTYDPDLDGDAYEDGVLEHDAVTYILIESERTFSRGDDLDTDNDGVLDLPAGAKIVDSLGSFDGGDGYVYSEVQLTQSASDPDAATRFYDDLTPNSLSAWANGDIFEDPNKTDEELPKETKYDTLQASSNLPPKAELTPGNHNFKKAPFVLLNEVVNSGDKYIELLSNADQNFDNIYVVTIANSTGVVDSVINVSGNYAKETGITVIKDNSANITIGSAIASIDTDLTTLNSNATSVLLIYSPNNEITINDDLDTNNNGKINLPDGAILLDNIGWGTTTYSDVVNSDTTVAYRYKDDKMVTTTAWGFETEYKTPANTNVAQAAKILVKPTLETARTTMENPDADDIAFWIHPSDPQNKSLIIGTQKVAGYSIYDVNGNTLIDSNPGNIRFNNVDVIYNFELNGENVDLALFTDRMTNKFAIYKITEDAPYITDVTDYTSEELFEAEEIGGDTAYGEAVYKSQVTGKTYAFATQNGTNNCAQFELIDNAGKVGWSKVRTITLVAGDDDEHAEGMVVDQEYGKLYIAQEDVGLYITDAESNGDLELGEDDLLVEEGDHDIAEDLEGLTIYYKDNGEGYVMISSQGNNTYGVFNRTANGVKNEYLTSFAVADDMNGIDGTQETDSLDVTNFALGSNFPNGAIIFQDGMDTTTDPDDIETNFKWIKWEDLATGLGDTTFTSNYNPRNPTNRR